MNIVEKDLIDDIFSYDTVLVPMSINNSFNHGFRRELWINFKDIKVAESKTPYGDRRKYGTVYAAEVSGITFVFCYMYMVQGKKTEDNDFVNYDSLKSCLDTVNVTLRGRKIASPLMGASLFDGNGNKEHIINIYNEVFGDGSTDITVYDYEYENTDKKAKRLMSELLYLRKNNLITKEEYDRRRLENAWRAKNGRFSPISEDFIYKNKQKRHVNSKD